MDQEGERLRKGTEYNQMEKDRGQTHTGMIWEQRQENAKGQVKKKMEINAQ